MSNWTLVLCRQHLQHPISDPIPAELWRQVFSYLRPWHAVRLSIFANLQQLRVIRSRNSRSVYCLVSPTPTGPRPQQILQPCVTRATQLRIYEVPGQRIGVVMPGLQGADLEGEMAELEMPIRVRGRTFRVIRSGYGTAIGIQVPVNLNTGCYYFIDSPRGQELIARYGLQPFMDGMSPPEQKTWVLGYRRMILT